MQENQKMFLYRCSKIYSALSAQSAYDKENGFEGKKKPSGVTATLGKGELSF